MLESDKKDIIKAIKDSASETQDRINSLEDITDERLKEVINLLREIRDLLKDSNEN